MILRPLNKLRLADRSLFGGKASALGEMHALGIRIPRGIAVGGVSEQDKAIQELDQELALQILNGLTVQGVRGGLIVRSSGVAEDSGKSSFAGQFLSMRTANSSQPLLDAMSKVWRAALAPHISEYAAARGVSSSAQDHHFSFFVQEYVAAEFSGVLFSRHPVADIPGWMLLEFVEGDAAEYISGRGSPLRCRVKDYGSKILWECRPSQPTPIEPGVRLLARIGAQLRTAFACEVDLEWGLVDSDPILFQCRPITTVSTHDNGLHSRQSANTKQHNTGRS